jgi:hypothetical protein
VADRSRGLAWIMNMLPSVFRLVSARGGRRRRALATAWGSTRTTRMRAGPLTLNATPRADSPGGSGRKGSSLVRSSPYCIMVRSLP